MAAANVELIMDDVGARNEIVIICEAVGAIAPGVRAMSVRYRGFGVDGMKCDLLFLLLCRDGDALLAVAILS